MRRRGGGGGRGGSMAGSKRPRFDLAEKRRQIKKRSNLPPTKYVYKPRGGRSRGGAPPPTHAPTLDPPKSPGSSSPPRDPRRRPDDTQDVIPIDPPKPFNPTGEPGFGALVMNPAPSKVIDVKDFCASSRSARSRGVGVGGAIPPGLPSPSYPTPYPEEGGWRHGGKAEDRRRVGFDMNRFGGRDEGRGEGREEELRREIRSLRARMRVKEEEIVQKDKDLKNRNELTTKIFNMMESQKKKSEVQMEKQKKINRLARKKITQKSEKIEQLEVDLRISEAKRDTEEKRKNAISNQWKTDRDELKKLREARSQAIKYMQKVDPTHFIAQYQQTVQQMVGLYRLQAKERSLLLSQYTIVDDILKAFGPNRQAILFKKLRVKFEDYKFEGDLRTRRRAQAGVDEGGLTNQMFTSFYKALPEFVQSREPLFTRVGSIWLPRAGKYDQHELKAYETVGKVMMVTLINSRKIPSTVMSGVMLDFLMSREYGNFGLKGNKTVEDFEMDMNLSTQLTGFAKVIWSAVQKGNYPSPDTVEAAYKECELEWKMKIATPILSKEESFRAIGALYHHIIFGSRQAAMEKLRRGFLLHERDDQKPFNLVFALDAIPNRSIRLSAISAGELDAKSIIDRLRGEQKAPFVYLQAILHQWHTQCPNRLPKFLEFVTGLTYLDGVILVEIEAGRPDMLPTAQTCFNTITLPAAPTEQALEVALTKAMDAGTTFQTE